MVSKFGKSNVLRRRWSEDIAEIQADIHFGKRDKESGEELIDLIRQYIAMYEYK